MRRLCRFAVRKELISVDPTIGIARYAENPDGYHTWTDLEIEQFENFHGIESKAVLALRLTLSTGAARQDVVCFGWQNISAGRIAYRRGKTAGDVDLPILDATGTHASSSPILVIDPMRKRRSETGSMISASPLACLSACGRLVQRGWRMRARPSSK